MENEKKALQQVELYRKKMTDFGDFLYELNISDFTCPICRDVMDTHCITLSSGKNYHEKCISLSIEELLKRKSPVICPLTRKFLSDTEKKFEFELDVPLMIAINSLFSLFIQGVLSKCDIASEPSSMEPWIEFEKKLVQSFPKKALEELKKHFEKGTLIINLISPQLLLGTNELAYIKIIDTHEKSLELSKVKMEGLIKEKKEAKLKEKYLKERLHQEALFNFTLTSELGESQQQLKDSERIIVQLDEKRLQLKQKLENLEKDSKGVIAQLEQKNLELKKFKDITDDLGKTTQTLETKCQHAQQQLTQEKQKTTQLDSINKRLLLRVRLKDLGLEKISLNFLQLPEKTFFQIYLHFNSSEDENLFKELFSLPRCIDITGEEKLQSTLKLLRNFEDIPVELTHKQKPAQWWSKTFYGLIEILQSSCPRTKEIITAPPLKDNAAQFFNSLSALSSASKIYFILAFDAISYVYIEMVSPLNSQTFEQLNIKNLKIFPKGNLIEIKFNLEQYEEALQEFVAISSKFIAPNSIVEVKANASFVHKAKLDSTINQITSIIPQAKKAFEDFFSNQHIIKKIIFTLEKDDITYVDIDFVTESADLKKLMLTELNLIKNEEAYWTIQNVDKKLIFIRARVPHDNDEVLKLLAYLSLSHNLKKIDIEFNKEENYDELPEIITLINNLIPNASEVFKAASVKPFWL